MNDNSSIDSILKWIHTLDDHIATVQLAPLDNVLAMTNARVIAAILAYLAPAHFDDAHFGTPTDTISDDEDGHRALVRALDAYHVQTFGLPANTIDTHGDDDSSALSLRVDALCANDTDQRSRLLLHVLGVMLESDKKAACVREILTQLGKAEQSQLMKCIQDLMSVHEQWRAHAASTDDTDHHDETHDDALNVGMGELDVAQRRQLLAAVAELEARLKDVEAQLKSERVARAEAEEKAESAAMSATQMQKVVAEREHLAAELRQRDRDMETLKRKEAEATQLRTQMRELRDKVDLLEEESAKWKEAEAREMRLKKRLEEMNDLRQKVKELEEAARLNDSAAQKSDGDARLVAQLRAQLDERQVEVNTVRAELTSLDAQVSAKEERAHRLQAELDEVTAQLTRAKSELRDAKATQGASATANDASVSAAAPDSWQAETNANGRNSELERLRADNARLRTELATAEATAAVAAAASAGAGSGNAEAAATGVYRAKIAELTKALEASRDEVRSLQAAPSGANAGAATDSDEVRSLRENVGSLQAEKTRLEGYLRTAKTMIKELRTKKKEEQEAKMADLQRSTEQQSDQLRRELEAARAELAEQRVHLAEARELAQRESQLMVSAFYEAGLELQRVKTEQAAAAGRKLKPLSFLQRQRELVRQRINP